jgi:hypothetical protein
MRDARGPTIRTQSKRAVIASVSHILRPAKDRTDVRDCTNFDGWNWLPLLNFGDQHLAAREAEHVAATAEAITRWNHFGTHH